MQVQDYGVTIIRPNSGQTLYPNGRAGAGLPYFDVVPGFYPGCPYGELHECPHFPDQAGYLLLHFRGSPATEICPAANCEAEPSGAAVLPPVMPAESAENRSGDV